MFIKGIGLISGAGIGLKTFQASFKKHNLPPVISDDIIKSYKLPRIMRRADRCSRLCAIAAQEAVIDSGTDNETLKNSNIFVVSALGPQQTTFSFLDDLIDYPEAEVSPTKFSHSVHNAAASYISILCGINGMSLTVTGFNNPWFNALVMAETVLSRRQCQQVLLIGADENGLLSELLKDDDKLFSIPRNLCECATGIILGNKPDSNDYCSISTPAFAQKEKADIIVRKNNINHDPKLQVNSGYLPATMFGNALECILTILNTTIARQPGALK